MRGRIFAAFVVFSALVLSILWISQTFFMDDLYKKVRLSELDKCADGLSDADVEDYSERALYLGERYNICITVYKIERGRGSAVVTCHVDGGCFIHNLTSETMQNDALLSRLYDEGRRRGRDGYMETVTAPDERESGTFVGDILYSRVVPSEQAEYMLLFNTEIYPLDSTVSTMRTMLAYISVILVVAAAVLSVILASRMSSPVRRMSREASRLALGDYGVRFDGGSVKELSELSDALNHAASELSCLDRMQKDLIANVSHDLRTPLTLISGYSEVMRDIPGEMTAENMQVIIDESSRLSVMVNDLLDMSRYISGKYTPTRQIFSMTEAVSECVDSYSKLCSRDGFVIEFEHDGELYVEGDRPSLQRVIYNLVANAVNYTGEDKRVKVRQISEGGACRIEISDSGAGIAKADLPLIWERYYRGDDFHKRSAVGSGLGLSIVKTILAAHQARFGVRSRVGHGSTFWFELPLSRDAGDTALD